MNFPPKKWDLWVIFKSITCHKSISLSNYEERACRQTFSQVCEGPLSYCLVNFGDFNDTTRICLSKKYIEINKMLENEIARSFFYHGKFKGTITYFWRRFIMGKSDIFYMYQLQLEITRNTLLYFSTLSSGYYQCC